MLAFEQKLIIMEISEKLFWFLRKPQIAIDKVNLLFWQYGEVTSN